MGRKAGKPEAAAGVGRARGGHVPIRGVQAQSGAGAARRPSVASVVERPRLRAHLVYRWRQDQARQLLAPRRSQCARVRELELELPRMERDLDILKKHRFFRPVRVNVMYAAVDLVAARWLTTDAVFAALEFSRAA